MPKLGSTARKSKSIAARLCCRPARWPEPRSRASVFTNGLSIAGNCRMCLVEVKGMPKPQASCALSVNDLAPRSERRAARSLHPHRDGEEGARRRDGVPAHQPSARLSDLRSGRRMRPPGSGHGLWHRQQPVCRKQARGRGQVHRSAGEDADEPLHSLHALRPLHDRGGRRRGTRCHRSRRGYGDHHLSRGRDDAASFRAT